MSTRAGIKNIQRYEKANGSLVILQSGLDPLLIFHWVASTPMIITILSMSIPISRPRFWDYAEELGIAAFCS